LGSLHSFNFFFGTDHSNWLVAEKTVGLVRHPQLINMKQKINKYPSSWKGALG
jgi:hypothetical protein